MKALALALLLTCAACSPTELSCKRSCLPDGYAWHERGVCDCITRGE
jgi:hypothetical protein